MKRSRLPEIIGGILGVFTLLALNLAVFGLMVFVVVKVLEWTGVIS